MERELYAMWNGVVDHDRFVKGLRFILYTDHKNNTFEEALLDNRRIAKKVFGWALDLQAYNFERCWIVGP